MELDEALARFFTRLAQASSELASDLRSGSASGTTDLDATIARLGSRQAQAYRTLVRAGRQLTTGEISRAIGYDFSNVWMTMKRLEQLNLVRMVAGANPQAWRPISHG